MQIKPIIPILILFVLIGVSASGKSSLPARKQLTTDEQIRFDYYFFEAQKLKDLAKFDEQLEALRVCVEIDSTNSAAQSEIGLLYGRMNLLPEASKAMKKAVDGNPENWWYRLHYITVLSGREQLGTAVEQAEELKKHYPMREEVYTILNSLYKQTGDYDKAIAALNQLEKFVGINEYLTFEKFQLYTLLKKEKQAVHEFDRLIAKHPRETRYKVLLGDIYLDQKQPKKAFEIYQKVQKEEPDNPYVYVSLANYYNQQNQSEKATESIVSALKNPSLPSETKMNILGQYVDRLLANQEIIDETEDLFKLLIEMYPFEEMPYAYYAVFLQNQERNDNALTQLENLITINPKNEAAWKTSLQILGQKEDTTGILNFTERAIKELPQVPDFYYYRSMAQFQQGNLKEALNTNQFALDNLSSSSELVLSTFYGQMGDIYYRMNDRQKAFENYEKAMEANPSNVYIMNNYAYYLSEEKKDLRKAERMSGKTVELEPNNSIYLDTYAWILYQQENYSLAKLYIDKAISNLKQEERESDVIYDHAGDIYFKLDNIDKALEMWSEALKVNKNNEEVKKKIEKYKNLPII